MLTKINSLVHFSLSNLTIHQKPFILTEINKFEYVRDTFDSLKISQIFC